MTQRVRRADGNVAHRVAHAAIGALALLTLAACGRGDTPAHTAGTAAGDPVAVLAREKACLNCHAIDRKLVGPSFADIATRYAGSAAAQPEVVALLARRIREGGSGSWGVVAMPASPGVTEAESQALAEWVLRQTPR